MDTAREIHLVESFVVSSKRTRYVGFLSSPKRRPKFLRELYHFGDFDPKWILELSGAVKSAEGLTTELERRGAPDRAYLVSAHVELDGKTLPLNEAVYDVYGRADGTIVCCVPGRLAYFEGEGFKNRYILHRPGSHSA